MFTFQPIGYVHSPFTDSTDIPKGPGTRHKAEGILEISTEFEEGLLDIEGFSHLFVIWVFHRSERYALTGVPPTDDRPHGVFATRSPYRPNSIALTVVELLGRQGRNLRVRGLGHGGRNADPRYQIRAFPQRDFDSGGLRKPKNVDDSDKLFPSNSCEWIVVPICQS
jgi:tRNA-Thr(GGU) m(6)t(6)A37 methyltransferase TsaA